MSGLRITPSGLVGCLSIEEHSVYLDQMLLVLEAASKLSNGISEELGDCVLAIAGVVRDSGYDYLIEQYFPRFREYGLPL
ncbi:hypothetical protein HN419_06550 [Candidatus Woesearchaeota archaeon]|jgi:hypothetical protein|nr:hypothetical protein [Candidatus Woesearchaeota archaeon]MBT3538155.1 hypothetical protein [Candidatus Woesearchaeota archaeon]MBT4697486.1 hypothetical protein [Candidatus Woesearchaeota archaeon]MBT4716870.1 hypothetical protein [Candidatus Woesearchaeota archaeon]MBT7105824.1 hypothetical protein [Candidatus Woesearchaeota archaeon]